MPHMVVERVSGAAEDAVSTIFSIVETVETVELSSFFYIFLKIPQFTDKDNFFQVAVLFFVCGLEPIKPNTARCIL